MWRASDFGINNNIMSSKIIMIVVTCKFCHEWNPNVVIKHFMVSATRCTKPRCSGAANNRDSELFSFDKGAFSAARCALRNLMYVHCTQATATVLSQDQDRPSLEGV